MIVKYFELKKEIKKNINFYLLYGSNIGLIEETINNIFKPVLSKNLYYHDEKEILANENEFKEGILNKSFFDKDKLIIINRASDKILDIIREIIDKKTEDLKVILKSEILEKKSKLRTFFEKEKNLICTACYLDNERDLSTIAQLELKKNNISLSRESINLLIEKSNADRSNLKNEIDKIISYSLSKKNIEFDEIKTLVNFTGEHKSDNLINECLCGNILQYKKILSELYIILQTQY